MTARLLIQHQTPVNWCKLIKSTNTYTLLLSYLGGFLTSWSFREESGTAASDGAFCGAEAAF